MTASPKAIKILGLLVLVVLVSVLTVKKTNFFSSQSSQLKITAKENKFQLEVTASQKDKSAFELLTKSTNIDLLTSPFTFELDSTNSAKLAFKTPIEADLKPILNKINFEGTFEGPIIAEAEITNLKIPTTTTLVIFAPDLKNIIQEKYSFGEEFKNWFNNNFKSNGQYLIIFDSQANWTLATINKNAEFESLINAKNSDEKSQFKEEQIEEETVYAISAQNSKGEDAVVVAIKVQDVLFLASSKEAASQIVKSQKQIITTKEFKKPIQDEKVALSVFFENENKVLSSEFYEFLGLNKESLRKNLNNIKKFNLNVKNNKFSGFVEY